MIQRIGCAQIHDIESLGYQSQLLKRRSPAREENLVIHREDTRSTWTLERAETVLSLLRASNL